MIITELFRQYERLRDAGVLPPYGFSREKVTGCVVLHPDGGVVTVEDMRHDAAVGKTLVKRPRLVDVPQPPRRTVAIQPGFLCDSAAYLFGVAEEAGKRARARAQFAASRARHEAVLAGIAHPAARAVLGALRSWKPGHRPPAQDPEILAGWLVFRLHNEEGFVHDLPEIRAAWERTLLAGEAGAATGQCLATGEEDQPIARIHPAIKGVPGAQAAGAALVSFNDDAYASYGKTQNFNAPVSTRAAHGYTAALNHLLAQRGKRHIVIGEVSVLFWTDRPTRFEDDVGFVFGRPEERTEEELALESRAALDRLAQGRHGLLPQEVGARLFMLGLSGNAARLAVRFWVADGLGAVADRLARHFQDIDLITPWDNQPRRPTVWTLVNETKIKRRRDGDHARPDPNDRGLAKLQGDLLRAVLGGGAYPASLLAVLLDRIRADRTLNHPRLALLKAVLVRRRRLAGLGQEGEGLVSLDPTRTDPGYRLGRLFAVLERVQQAAAGGRDLTVTIRDTHIGAASATPRAVFPVLLDVARKRLEMLRRTKPGLARVLEAALQDILGPLPGFPPALGLDQRALFFLGHHHERAARKTGMGPGAAPAGTDDAPVLPLPE